MLLFISYQKGIVKKKRLLMSWTDDNLLGITETFGNNYLYNATKDR